MNNKLKLIIGFLILVAVIVSVAAFMLNTTASMAEMALLVTIVVVLIGTAIIFWQRTKDAKKGLPTEDERSQKTGWKAGYFAFIAAIWSAVGINWIDIFVQEEIGGTALTLSQGTGVVVLVSGLVFIFSYLILNKKES